MFLCQKKIRIEINFYNQQQVKLISYFILINKTNIDGRMNPANGWKLLRLNFRNLINSFSQIDNLES